MNEATVFKFKPVPLQPFIDAFTLSCFPSAVLTTASIDDAVERALRRRFEELYCGPRDKRQVRIL